MMAGWEVVAAVALAVSVVTDLQKRLVYNWVTVPAMVLGLGLAWLERGWPGVAWSLSGLLVGGALLLPPFLLGSMGGGDVKLVAALGALGGPIFAVQVLVYACLAGGVASVAIMLTFGSLGAGLRYLWQTLVFALRLGRGAARPQALGLPGVPYAVCIAAGALLARLGDYWPGAPWRLVGI